MKDKKIYGIIQKVGTLSGTVKDDQFLKANIIKGLGPPAPPTYTGAYTVKPLPFNESILPTSGKSMKKDVTVLEIPYYETTNLQGGYTVIIGE